MKPLISIVMPIYNDALYIEVAIEAILNQSYKNLELIISDDVSSDNSYKICENYKNKDNRIKLYSNQTNLGPYRNWKNAISHVRGMYVMFTTGHDVWDSYILEKYINEIENHSDCALVYSPTTLIDQNGEIIKTRDIDKIFKNENYGLFNAIITGNINSDAFCGLIRTEKMLKTSLQPVSIGNDTIFLSELSLYGEFKQLRESYYYRRQNRKIENIGEKIKRYSKNIIPNLDKFWVTVFKETPFLHMVYQYVCMVQNNNIPIKDQGILIEMIFDTFKTWGVDPNNFLEKVSKYNDITIKYKSEYADCSIRVGKKIAKRRKLSVNYSDLHLALEHTRYKSYVKLNKTQNYKYFQSENEYDVCYVLEDTGKWGGVKGTFVQANGLTELGYKVVVVSKSNAPNWYKLHCDYLKIDNTLPYEFPSSDIYIGTWYKTLEYINKIENGVKIHYCRGYEGDFNCFSIRDKEEIERIYNYQTIKIANSKSIKEFLDNKFQCESHLIKNDLNTKCFRRYEKKAISSDIKILIVGPYEVEWKGIRKSIEIGSELKNLLAPKNVKLIRVSQINISCEEQAILDTEFKDNYEYLFDLNEDQMAEVYNEATVFLSGSHSQESFGRPAMEALACGLPSVLTDISAYRDYDNVHDYCLFYNVGDTSMAISKIMEIMKNKSTKDTLVKRGLEVASKYSINSTIKELDNLLNNIMNNKSLKNSNYFSYTRPEVQQLVNVNSKFILDVGCANGSMGQELKSNLDAEVWGVEYDSAAANVARCRLDRVLEGDIISILDNLPEKYFDTIIFADVLEHTPRPEIILNAIKKTLKTNGEIVISLPNVRHWTVIKSLLEGDWKYEEAGLLDKTHLQFFTKKSIIRMMNKLNYIIIEMFSTRFDLEKVPTGIVSDLSRYGINTSTLLEESLDYQYIFKCKIK